MKLIFTSIIFSLFFVPCFAQQRETLMIEEQYFRKQIPLGKGRLTLFASNLCGERVEGVKIRIEGEMFKRKLKSNKSGRAEIMLPEGTYRVSVNKYGFMSYVVTVEVPANSDKGVQFNMKEGYSSSDPKEGLPLKCPPRGNVENVVIYELVKN